MSESWRRNPIDVNEAGGILRVFFSMNFLAQSTGYTSQDAEIEVL
jgi:hypothetical protein